MFTAFCSNGAHCQAYDDFIFRFAVLGLVLMLYPSIKLHLPEEVPDDFFQGQSRIGAAVRGVMPSMGRW